MFQIKTSSGVYKRFLMFPQNFNFEVGRLLSGKKVSRYYLSLLELIRYLASQCPYDIFFDSSLPLRASSSTSFGGCSLCWMFYRFVIYKAWLLLFSFYRVAAFFYENSPLLVQKPTNQGFQVEQRSLTEL